MKTNKILALAFAAAMMFSCSEKPEETPDAPVAPQPQTKTLTFTLPTYGEGAGQGLKTAWVAGDQIAIHGEYAAKQVIVTLAASDIAQDGKTATKTVEGLYPYERADYQSTLYAAYPADAVDNLKHCFFYTKFKNSNVQLLAACNNGDSFKFEDVCGGLAFTLDEKFDSFELTGLKKETLGYEFIQVKVTEEEKNFKQYIGAGLSTVTGKVSEGTTVVFFPDEIAASGCMIKFYNGEQVVNNCKLDTPFTVKRGKVTDLGNITSKLAKYENPFSPDIKDLDKDGNANCYIVTEAGSYKFKAVRGNASTDFVTGIAEACVLWETYNNAEEVVAGSVVASAAYAEDYIIIHMPQTITPGNAVVAAKAADGTILWSWHIWVPATKIETNTYGIFTTALMDRHLGALVAAVAGNDPVDITSCGLIYQWGRKDPFVNAASMKSSGNATVAGAALEMAAGKISFEDAIAHPTLLGHSQNGDWLDVPDQTLWQDDVKTIYDPCPVGYKVPSRDKSTVLFSGSYDSAKGWKVSSSAYWITLGDPATVFPVAGYRDDYSVSKMANSGVRTAVWSGHCSADATAYYLNWRVDKGTYVMGEGPKARGCSVRCVAE